MAQSQSIYSELSAHVLLSALRLAAVSHMLTMAQANFDNNKHPGSPSPEVQEVSAAEVSAAVSVKKLHKQTFEECHNMKLCTNEEVLGTSTMYPT